MLKKIKDVRGKIAHIIIPKAQNGLDLVQFNSNSRKLVTWVSKMLWLSLNKHFSPNQILCHKTSKTNHSFGKLNNNLSHNKSVNMGLDVLI